MSNFIPEDEAKDILENKGCPECGSENVEGAELSIPRPDGVHDGWGVLCRNCWAAGLVASTDLHIKETP